LSGIQATSRSRGIPAKRMPDTWTTLKWLFSTARCRAVPPPSLICKDTSATMMRKLAESWQKIASLKVGRKLLQCIKLLQCGKIGFSALASRLLASLATRAHASLNCLNSASILIALCAQLVRGREHACEGGRAWGA
jgi:hypothetical protein